MTLKEAYDEAIMPTAVISHYPWAKPVMKGKIIVNLFDNLFTCSMIRMTENGSFLLRTHLEDCRTLFLELPANYKCEYHIPTLFGNSNLEPKPKADAYLAFGFEKLDYSSNLGKDLKWKHPDITTN